MKGTTYEIKAAFKKQLPSAKVSVRTKQIGDSWYESVTIKTASVLTENERTIAQSIVSEFEMRSYINGIKIVEPKNSLQIAGDSYLYTVDSLQKTANNW